MGNQTTPHRIHGIGIFTYIYHKNQPNVGKYTIHGSYGYLQMYGHLKDLLVLTSVESKSHTHNGPSHDFSIKFDSLQIFGEFLKSTSHIVDMFGHL